MINIKLIEYKDKIIKKRLMLGLSKETPAKIKKSNQKSALKIIKKIAIINKLIKHKNRKILKIRVNRISNRIKNRIMNRIIVSKMIKINLRIKENLFLKD